MITEPADSIRAAGLRVTSQRLAVLEVLSTLPHADTETVHRAVRSELPGISLQSVYVVLAALTEAQIIRRIEPAGSPALYERRIGDNHHHAICTRCGAVQDIDCAVGEAPCLTPSEAGGFAISTAEVTYWGLCAPCQNEYAEHALAVNESDVFEAHGHSPEITAPGLVAFDDITPVLVAFDDITPVTSAFDDITPDLIAPAIATRVIATRVITTPIEKETHD